MNNLHHTIATRRKDSNMVYRWVYTGETAPTDTELRQSDVLINEPHYLLHLFVHLFIAGKVCKAFSSLTPHVRLEDAIHGIKAELLDYCDLYGLNDTHRVGIACDIHDADGTVVIEWTTDDQSIKSCIESIESETWITEQQHDL